MSVTWAYKKYSHHSSLALDHWKDTSLHGTLTEKMQSHIFETDAGICVCWGEWFKNS